MLLIKTKLASSQIHGIGLFTDEFISAGTSVWRFLKGFDIEMAIDELANLPIQVQSFIRRWGYLDRSVNKHLLPVDDARFINHSYTPNIRTIYTQDPYGIDFSLCNISIGDEITIDYDEIEQIEHPYLKNQK